MMSMSLSKMSSQDIEAELKTRIRRDIAFYDGNLPERFSVAWRAYLAGILEWGIIEVSSYDELLKLLPDVEDNPAVAILKGRED